MTYTSIYINAPGEIPPLFGTSGGTNGIARYLGMTWRMVRMFMTAAISGTHSTREYTLFAQLLEDYNRLINRLAFSYSSTPQELEDLRQDILLNIWRALPSFREESSLKTWCYRIALNTCVSTIRARSSRPQSVKINEIVELVAADNDTETRDRLEQLHQLLSTLCRSDRAMILMQLDGYSYDEIAQVMGMPRNTVASRLHRAIAALKKQSKYNQV